MKTEFDVGNKVFIIIFKPYSNIFDKVEEAEIDKIIIDEKQVVYETCSESGRTGHTENNGIFKTREEAEQIAYNTVIHDIQNRWNAIKDFRDKYCKGESGL